MDEKQRAVYSPIAKQASFCFHIMRKLEENAYMHEVERIKQEEAGNRYIIIERGKGITVAELKRQILTLRHELKELERLL